MADVDQFRISSPSIARRQSGRDLFESHNALLGANRFNVPIMVRINQRTVDGPGSAVTPPAEAIRRIEFRNHTVYFFRRGGGNVPQGRNTFWMGTGQLCWLSRKRVRLNRYRSMGS
jgi:hypothetical protein